MSAEGLRAVFRRLQRLADPAAAGLGDAELFERYTRSRDEAAFELLLWRHGPMVLGVCRRMLRRAEDADDAFQATFLTLVRRAGTVRKGCALGAWLYQVAYRIALRARAGAPAGAEPGSEPAVSDPDPAWRDLRPVLDEEVHRLPARYRAPVVLCYLEGRTHAEAARELGCPKGTVAVRLSRARKLLQNRLTRRGVTLAGGLVAAAAVPPAPASLVARTLQAAANGAAAGRVVALTEGAIHAMSLTRLKATAALALLTVGLAVSVAAVATRAAPPQGAAPVPSTPGAERRGEPDVSRRPLVRVPAPVDGQLLVVGTEIGPGEQVPEGRRVAATAGYLIVPVSDKDRAKRERVVHGPGDKDWRPWQPDDPVEPGRVSLLRIKKEYKRLKVGDEVNAGQTLALIDPALALNDLHIKVAALDAAESERRAAMKTREEAERRVAAMEESLRRVPGSVSKDDYEMAKLTARKYAEEEIAKRSAVFKAQQELIQAQTLVTVHEVHSSVTGVIKSIDREAGDAVKLFETVLVLELPRETRTSRPVDASQPSRDVRASSAGFIAVVGSELKPGEAAPAGREVTVGTGTAARHYRKLEPGDAVDAGQLVAQLDDRLARQDLAIREAQLQAAEAAHRSATKTREEAERRVKANEESMRRVPGSVSRDDYSAAKLTLLKYQEEEVAAKAGVERSAAELERAKIVLGAYAVRSPVRGVVRELLKFPGEAVQFAEPVIRLTVAAP